MCNINQVAQDMLRWGKEQDPQRGRLFRKKDIIEYTGFGRDKVDELVFGLPAVGGRATYFYLDVAERLLGITR